MQDLWEEKITQQLTREISCKWVEDLDCDSEYYHDNQAHQDECLYWKSDDYNCIKDYSHSIISSLQDYGMCTAPGLDHDDFNYDFCLAYEYPEYDDDS